MSQPPFPGLVAVSALMLALAAPAQAQMSTRQAAAPAGDIVTGVAEQVAAAMAAEGFQTTPTTANDGTPKLDGKIEGWMYSVYFYGCDSGVCDAIQFAAGFDEDQPMQYDLINDWNRNNRFGRAYLDDEGDPWVEMDLNLEGGGVPVGNFNESLAYWSVVLRAFVNHIGW